MGHHYNTIRGVGKDRQEAQSRAIDDFLYEEGHRHSVRGVDKAELIQKVPPMRIVTEGNFMFNKPDPNAPESEWLEEWQFELHTHA